MFIASITMLQFEVVVNLCLPTLIEWLEQICLDIICLLGLDKIGLHKASKKIQIKGD